MEYEKTLGVVTCYHTKSLILYWPYLIEKHELNDWTCNRSQQIRNNYTSRSNPVPPLNWILWSDSLFIS